MGSGSIANVCFWPKPIFAFKHFHAVIPGLANGETRATKRLLAVGCAMLVSRRSRDRGRAVRQGSTLLVMGWACVWLAIELKRKRSGVDAIRRA